MSEMLSEMAEMRIVTISTLNNLVYGAMNVAAQMYTILDPIARQRGLLHLRIRAPVSHSSFDLPIGTVRLWKGSLTVETKVDKA
jgi:hypothetical protein